MISRPTSRLAIRISLLISLFAFITPLTRAADASFVIDASADSLTRYRLHIEMPNAQLDGICLIKIIDNDIKGVIINDFGIKALEFAVSSDRKRVTLQHVMPALDHWYIKRTIKDDFKILFSATQLQNNTQNNSTQVTTHDNGNISLVNRKRKIQYDFVKEETDNTQPEIPSIE